MFTSGSDTTEGKKTLKQEALDMMGKRKPTNPLPKKHYKSEQDCQNQPFQCSGYRPKDTAKRSLYSRKLLNFR